MDIPILITSDANIFYYTGFSSSNAMVMLGLDGQAMIITDFRYEQAAKKTGFPVKILKSGQTMEQAVIEVFQSGDHSGLLFEPEHTNVEQFFALSKEIHMIPVEKDFKKIRGIKDENECKEIRIAADIASDTIAFVMEHTIKEGITELDVAAELDYQMRKRGASEPSFDTIVAFGANSSMPHYVPGNVPLKAGDTVLIDMGAKHNGYCSDMTRTFYFGHCPMQEVYEIVKTAQQMALDAIAPGMTCRELDAVARDYITEKGYGKHFGHGLGHGVGLEIHEYPTVNGTGEDILVPGMVITIEPGIYLPEKGGVRIEDMGVVTSNGFENYTKQSKELTIIK